MPSVRISNKVNDAVAPLLKKGGVGILPTDTIYGIVGSALRKAPVERIYHLRRRNRKKPMIVLVGSMSDLAHFGIKLGARDRAILRRLWPGKVSIVLPCRSVRFAYLHRGTKTVAFRMPRPAWLRRLLRRTGPLVAPSANVEGEPPSRTVRDAKGYFGDKADFYVDVGRLVSRPSTLVKLEDGELVVLRKGAVRV